MNINKLIIELNMNRFEKAAVAHIRSLSVDSPLFNSLSQKRSLLLFYQRIYKGVLGFFSL
jgi:hypothetical protein